MDQNALMRAVVRLIIISCDDLRFGVPYTSTYSGAIYTLIIILISSEDVTCQELIFPDCSTLNKAPEMEERKTE